MRAQLIRMRLKPGEDTADLKELGIQLRALMADIFDGPAEFTGLRVAEERTG